MEVHLRALEEALSAADIIYLATSYKDAVAVRPISPLNIGRTVYIRTSSTTRKATQMQGNPNIAACVGNFYFTGKAICMGSVLDGKNESIRKAYKRRYPESFGVEDSFTQTDDVFYELTIETVSEWIYKDGEPVGFAAADL